MIQHYHGFLLWRRLGDATARGWKLGFQPDSVDWHLVSRIIEIVSDLEAHQPSHA